MITRNLRNNCICVFFKILQDDKILNYPDWKISKLPYKLITLDIFLRKSRLHKILKYLKRRILKILGKLFKLHESSGILWEFVAKTFYYCVEISGHNGQNTYFFTPLHLDLKKGCLKIHVKPIYHDKCKELLVILTFKSLKKFSSSLVIFSWIFLLPESSFCWLALSLVLQESVWMKFIL